MSAMTLKRKITAIQPKIHVKGAKILTDDEVKVKKEKKTTLKSEEIDSETRAHVDQSDDSSSYEEKGSDADQIDADEKEDGTVKKIKSKEERMAEKKERKEKRMEKLSEKNQRTIFVGNLPSTCQPRVSTASVFRASINFSNLLNQELRKHFLNCGAIESVRLRGIIPSNPKMHKKAAAIT
jgi:RNA recognition motif-containing protein